MNYFGDFAEDATVRIPFNTFTSNDPTASSTITNLADADIKVHKDGGLTQIVTDGATVIIDFDSITGNHLITIDTSVHADYAVGSDYQVRIEGITVDAGTINAWVGSFSIENRYQRQTGDSFARLGAPAGASHAADILVIDNFVDELESRLTAARATNLDEVTAVRMATLTDWINGGRLDLLLDAIPTTAMRGTDSVPTNPALDTVCTEARLSELDAGTAGKAANQIDIIHGLIDTEIADILLDTSTTLDAKIQAVKDKTDQMVFTLTNLLDTNAKAMNDSTEAADDMKTAAETMVKGSAATGTLSNTEITTNLTIIVPGQYNGGVLIFAKDTITAALRRQRTDITATTVLNGKLGFTAITTAPVNGDTFIIV